MAESIKKPPIPHGHHTNCSMDGCFKCPRMEHHIKEICKKCCPEGKPGEDGITPHIGENGNWWIGDIDTSIHAKGDKATRAAQI